MLVDHTALTRTGALVRGGDGAVSGFAMNALTTRRPAVMGTTYLVSSGCYLGSAAGVRILAGTLTIAVGSDADLVVWDPEACRTSDGSRMQSNAGYSVCDGWQVRGWPVYTVSRGDVVFDRGQVVAERGRGRWVRRRREARR